MIKRTFVGHSKITGEKVFKVEASPYTQGYVTEKGAAITQDKIEFYVAPEPKEETEPETKPFEW